jgi:hypothetical protein
MLDQRNRAKPPSVFTSLEPCSGRSSPVSSCDEESSSYEMDVYKEDKIDLCAGKFAFSFLRIFSTVGTNEMLFGSSINGDSMENFIHNFRNGKVPTGAIPNFPQPSLDPLNESNDNGSIDSMLLFIFRLN